MYRLGVALHVVSVAIWLGASLTFMVFGPASRNMPLESWANVWITLARLQRAVVGPACVVGTVTGLLLTMSLSKSSFDVGGTTWLMAMQVLGILAAILTVAFVTPLTGRMAVLARRSLEKGQQDPTAAHVNRTLAIMGSIAGALILASMFFGAAKP